MKCSNCDAEGTIPVVYVPNEVWSCDSCWPSLYGFLKSKKGQTCDLHSSVDNYTRKDGSKGRITKGKAWEIENRRTTPEGQVINRITKREAQY